MNEQETSTDTKEEAATQEAGTQDTAPTGSVEPAPVPEGAPETPVSESEKPAQKNFAALRKKAEDFERRTRELEEYIRRANPLPKQEEEALIPGVGKEELITLGQAEQIAAKQVEKALRKHQVDTAEERLKLKYSDFDSVVNSDSVEQFREEMPEVAKAIYEMRDVHDKGAALYKAMKKFSINTQPDDQYLKDRAQAEKNLKKPISSSAPNKSPIADAHRFEGSMLKDLMAQKYKEMREAIKRG